MATGYEVRYYHAIDEIAKSIHSLAKSQERIAQALERIAPRGVTFREFEEDAE